MQLPTACDIRDKTLQGFNITEQIVCDDFIDDAICRQILPYVNDFTRNSFGKITQAVEYHNGTGKDEMMLDRKNIVSLDAIRLVSGNDIDTTINIASLEIIYGRGVLKVKSGLSEYYNYRIFPKGNDNIKVTYSYGTYDIPPDIFQAISMLTAIIVLDQMEGRTGGGQLSGQNYQRQYGNMGKFGNVRKRFNQQAHAILRRYSSSVVGA